MSSFERLPTELRILILKSIPDQTTLRNLLHSSPLYHDTYALAQKDILHNLVQRQYGLVDLEEPFAAIHSTGLHADVPSNKEKILALLHHLRVHRQAQQDQQSPLFAQKSASRTLNIEKSYQLLHLHQKFDALVTAYAQSTTSQDQESYTPSPSEKARILRSLCRLQTYYNIFGAREWVEPIPEPSSSLSQLLSSLPQTRLARKSSTWYRNFTVDEMWDQFFGAMPAWEVEELGSLWAFLRGQYESIFSAMEFPRSDARWRALRPVELPVDPWELYPCADGDETDESAAYNIYTNHLVSLGPIFLHKVLSSTQDSRLRLLASNSIASKSSFMDTVQMIRARGAAPPVPVPAVESESSAGADAGKTLRSNDTLATTPATLPELSLPNPGWQARSADALETFGFFGGWEWGYAIWDQEGAKESECVF